MPSSSRSGAGRDTRRVEAAVVDAVVDALGDRPAQSLVEAPGGVVRDGDDGARAAHEHRPHGASRSGVSGMCSCARTTTGGAPSTRATAATSPVRVVLAWMTSARKRRAARARPAPGAASCATPHGRLHADAGAGWRRPPAAAGAARPRVDGVSQRPAGRTGDRQLVVVAQARDDAQQRLLGAAVGARVVGEQDPHGTRRQARRAVADHRRGAASLRRWASQPADRRLRAALRHQASDAACLRSSSTWSSSAGSACGRSRQRSRLHQRGAAVEPVSGQRAGDHDAAAAQPLEHAEGLGATSPAAPGRRARP